MIPEIITERSLVNGFGFKCVQYHVLYEGNHYIISQARTDIVDLETLVFPCNEKGECENMIEIVNARGVTIDEVWAKFGLLLLEADHDPI